MRLIGKLLALPFMLVTGILYLVCKFLVVLSGAVLGILSGIIFLAALVLFFVAGFLPGLAWLGNKKQPSFQEQIRIVIDAALEEKPKDFEELLKKLEAAGIEVNRERKHLRFRVPGQENYTRCDTLKGDYTEQAIKERIAGTRAVKPCHAFSKNRFPKLDCWLILKLQSVPARVLVMSVGQKCST